jgi:hypothetical protein
MASQTMHLSRRHSLILALATLLFPVAAAAQQPEPAEPPTASPIPLQSELNLINLPTTLSIANHHSYFRLTHRFARDLRRGDFSDLAADLFSLDNGAVIGFEYRFGVMPHLQAGVHRSMLSKTIQTFARWDAIRQGDRLPVSISLTGSFEGLNNLRENHQPAAVITVSRVFGDVAVLYFTPGFVGNTRAVDTLEGHEDHDHGGGLEEVIDEHAGHDDTWFAGFGTRIRFLPTAYVVGEYTPRLGGYDPNKATWGVGIEKRTGGHTLQLNFTNSFGTTFGQLARGGNPHDVYLGFNITRKF